MHPEIHNSSECSHHKFNVTNCWRSPKADHNQLYFTSSCTFYYPEDNYIPSPFFFKDFFFPFIWEIEREHMTKSMNWGRGRDDRLLPTELGGGEPNMGLSLRTLGPRTMIPAEGRCLNNYAIQMSFFSFLLKFPTCPSWYSLQFDDCFFFHGEN